MKQSGHGNHWVLKWNDGDGDDAGDDSDEYVDDDGLTARCEDGLAF